MYISGINDPIKNQMINSISHIWILFQVKVLSVTGQKVSLTMKDVCQETGKDLNPTSHAHLEVSTSSYEIKIIVFT